MMCPTLVCKYEYQIQLCFVIAKILNAQIFIWMNFEISAVKRKNMQNKLNEF